jgi:hypothetical protein
MKKIVFILMIFTLVVPISCKKEWKKTTVDGTVRDFITGNPLQGVEVYLQKSSGVTPLLELTNTVTYLSAVTDTDSKFKFEFRAEKDKLYGLEYQKPLLCYYDYDSPQGFNVGETNTIDIKLHSWNTLSIHIKNTSPFDTNDHICYVFDKNSSSCTWAGYTGMTIDYVNEITVDAYEKVYIKSFITKNSVLVTRLDSITISPCTPQTIDVFY